MSERIWVPAKPEDDFDILIQAKDRGGQRIAVIERTIDDETASNILIDWYDKPAGSFQECTKRIINAALGIGGDDAE